MKFSFSRLPVFSFSRFLVLLVTATLLIAQAYAQLVEIPDSNLERAIRETLELPDGTPITQQDMEQLTRLSAWDSGITDLTGLEHAIYLNHLALRFNQIHNLSPISNLIHLEDLTLDENPIDDLAPLSKLVNLKFLSLSGIKSITDISILANLTKLERLYLNRLPISNISPLADLTNLKILWIQRTFVTDLTPLQHLNIPDFRYDEICNISPILPSVRERIESRSFPSVFQAWGGIGWSPVENRPDLSDEEHITLHDLHWHPKFETIQWDTTPTEPTEGIATSLAGDMKRARYVRQRRLDQNPNMIFLGGFSNTAHFTDDKFPPNSDFWLRDTNGEILRKRDNKLLIDFVKPEVQDLLAKRAIAFARCGLYDGIMLDEFARHGTGFSGRHLYPYTDEEIIQAYTNIFQMVRSQVHEDFLILINATDTKPIHYAKYINGTFMEIGKDSPHGYSRALLMKLEDILSWAEKDLRSPQINCLQGQGLHIEPPDGPNNLRWMRLFTNLSLTHSDGYVLYTDGRRDFGGGDHHHLWHSFWDADLGRPVGPKAQTYQNVDGLFSREFTNGWAVYNRSGKVQTITLPASATPVSDRGNSTASMNHLLPDLDGEIYLTTKSFADVNRDGNVNILDLVQVANGFGEAIPDPNGDGNVDILDLVFVAQQFSE